MKILVEKSVGVCYKICRSFRFDRQFLLEDTI